jgi:DNA-binding HxlR family transcriptional regulator
MSGRLRATTSGRHVNVGCPACQGIEVLQEKWVLHIVHALLDGPKGFNALGREVGGCNPTTLTQRLARLESLGLIAKLDHAGSDGAASGSNGRSGRGCYTLTPSGRELDRVIVAIKRWAEAHLSDDDGGGVASGG